MLNVSNKFQIISISSFVFILAGLVIFLSSPGWSGEFWFDDFPNIVNNPAIQIQSLDYVSLLKSTSPTASGSGMTRPVSYTTFAVNYYFSGLHSYASGESVSMPNGVYVSIIVIFLIIISAFFSQRTPIANSNNNNNLP